MTTEIRGNRRSRTVVSVYKARDGWRWHRTAVNGNIVSESGEAYVRRCDAVRMASKLNPDCKIEIDS